MDRFQAKTFKLNQLIGLSETSIVEHLKLYNGYVSNSNLVIKKIFEYNKDLENNSYILGELYRRFSFEYNGMRNHEYYFHALENGPSEINKEGDLYKMINKEWTSFENFLIQFKKLAMTRGIGWAILNYDKINNNLYISWVDEQHLGQLGGVYPILCLDMWEHSYVYDYLPSGKKQYIEDFFLNLNWNNIEKNLI